MRNVSFTVRTLVALLAVLFGRAITQAQIVYSTNFKSEADVKVYVTSYKSMADLVVYKSRFKSEATGNQGFWYFTTYRSEAKKRIYFTDFRSEADLIVYFTDYRSEAGWRDRSKMHLMY